MSSSRSSDGQERHPYKVEAIGSNPIGSINEYVELTKHMSEAAKYWLRRAQRDIESSDVYSFRGYLSVMLPDRFNFSYKLAQRWNEASLRRLNRIREHADKEVDRMSKKIPSWM